MAASVAAADSAGDLCRFNPFLTPNDAEGISCCVILLMMTANRINLCTLALQQSRTLLKLLLDFQRQSSEEMKERLRKELLSLGENLAVILSSRRFYASQRIRGTFEIDPRFLLFEFCHGILLRETQVQLVRKLMIEIQEGRSICTQVGSNV